MWLHLSIFLAGMLVGIVIWVFTEALRETDVIVVPCKVNDDGTLGVSFDDILVLMGAEGFPKAKEVEPSLKKEVADMLGCDEN